MNWRSKFRNDTNFQPSSIVHRPCILFLENTRLTQYLFQKLVPMGVNYRFMELMEQLWPQGLINSRSLLWFKLHKTIQQKWRVENEYQSVIMSVGGSCYVKSDA